MGLHKSKAKAPAAPVKLAKPAAAPVRRKPAGRRVDVLVPRVGDELAEREHVADVLAARLGEV